MTATVNADDDAPAADVWQDQVVREHDIAQFSGGGSDTEGQTLTHEWVQVSGSAVHLRAIRIPPARPSKRPKASSTAT